MDQQAFIDAINIAVVDSSTKGVREGMEKPPGRSPRESLLKMSAFYKGLSEADKTTVDMIINKSVEMAVFQFCVC